MNKEVQQFVSILFMSRNYAHKAHLYTDSYAEHKALQKFYEDIVGLTDDFAEAWQGRYQQKIGELPELPEPKSEPLKVMKRILDTIENIRDFVPKEDTALNNIVDEIVDLFLSTIYKLKFLK